MTCLCLGNDVWLLFKVYFIPPVCCSACLSVYCVADWFRKRNKFNEPVSLFLCQFRSGDSLVSDTILITWSHTYFYTTYLPLIQSKSYHLICGFDLGELYNNNINLWQWKGRLNFPFIDTQTIFRHRLVLKAPVWLVWWAYKVWPTGKSVGFFVWKTWVTSRRAYRRPT